MTGAAESHADLKLVALAKTINDLDDLVRLIRHGLTRTKPWQRQLSRALLVLVVAAHSGARYGSEGRI